MAAEIADAFPWEPASPKSEEIPTLKSLLVRQLVSVLAAMLKHGMLTEGTTCRIERPGSAGVTLELRADRVQITADGAPAQSVDWDAEEQLFAGLNELFILRAIRRSAETG